MITPEEARRISEENPNEKLARAIRMVEEEIEREAGKGRRVAMIDYTDGTYAHELAEHFRRLGFGIDCYSETLGGVRQHTAYYARW